MLCFQFMTNNRKVGNFSSQFHQLFFRFYIFFFLLFFCLLAQKRKPRYLIPRDHLIKKRVSVKYLYVKSVLIKYLPLFVVVFTLFKMRSFYKIITVLLIIIIFCTMLRVTLMMYVTEPHFSLKLSLNENWTNISSNYKSYLNFLFTFDGFS